MLFLKLVGFLVLYGDITRRITCGKKNIFNFRFSTFLNVMMSGFDFSALNPANIKLPILFLIM
jgi:hypothetical protein